MRDLGEGTLKKLEESRLESDHDHDRDRDLLKGGVRALLLHRLLPDRLHQVPDL